MLLLGIWIPRLFQKLAFLFAAGLHHYINSINFVFLGFIVNPTFLAANSKSLDAFSMSVYEFTIISRSSVNLSNHKLLLLLANWLLFTHCISLTTFSSTELNWIRDNASPCFNPVPTLNWVDIVLSTLTLYCVLSIQSLVSLINFLGNPKSCIMLYRLSLCILSYAFFKSMNSCQMFCLYSYLFSMICPIIDSWSIVEFLFLESH